MYIGTVKNKCGEAQKAKIIINILWSNFEREYILSCNSESCDGRPLAYIIL